MAYLLNRNPAARFECLHSLVKLIHSSFGYNAFSLNDVKYNPDSDNVHNYCPLLVDSGLGINYCPYLQNPLSEAGCNMTNGVECDSTKSKEVSNTINALHALGFVSRQNREVRLTPFGKRFATTTFGSKEMQEIIQEAVLHYGPVVGVLKQVSDITKVGGSFSTGDIFVGYPNTDEEITYNGDLVRISAGSTDDSNTRTKSLLLAWLTAGGFVRPVALPALSQEEVAHRKYQDFINQAHRGNKRYVYVKAAPFLSSQSFCTMAPLDYVNLTKMTRALRENNQAEIREATMYYEGIIRNRRLAILYFLNEAYTHNQKVEYGQLIAFINKYPSLFVIDPNNVSDVMEEEIKIADMAGCPFKIIAKDSKIFLSPLAGVNLSELMIGVPDNVKQALKTK